MAVHGTRQRDSVVWDYAGLLRFFAGLARDRTGLPVLRCYWYEATVDSRRTSEHDVLADLPGLKLRLGKMRPGRREGVETDIHRDLTTLARNRAISDAVIVCAEEDLAQVLADVQDLGIRVLLVHITADGSWTISRALRQECDDIVEVSAAHLQPFVDLITGADPVRSADPVRYAAPTRSPEPARASESGPSAGDYASAPSPVPDLPNGNSQRSGTVPHHGLPPQALPASPASYPAEYPRPGQPPGAGASAEHPVPAGPQPSLGVGRAVSGSQPDQSTQDQRSMPEQQGAGQGHGAQDRGIEGKRRLHDQALGLPAPEAGRNAPGSPPASGQAQSGVSPPSGNISATNGQQPYQLPEQLSGTASPRSRNGPPGGLPPGGSAQRGVQRSGPEASRMPQNGPGFPQNGLPQSGPDGSLPRNELPQNGLDGARPQNGRPSPDTAPQGGQSRQLPDGRGAQYPQDPAGHYGPADHGLHPQFPSAPTTRPGPAYSGSGYTVPAQEPCPGSPPAAGHPQVPPPVSLSLPDAVQAAHAEGYGFGDTVARDAPALWLEAVLARKPRMPSDLEARLLHGSALPIDSLQHDEVRHALRLGFWDALERSRR